MLDPMEKRQAIEEARDASMLLEKHQADVPVQSFYKALRNYVQRTTPARPAHFKMNNLEDVFMHMVQIGTEESTFVRSYKSSELATFFGVTIATIHNWIMKGRFIGLEKPVRFKQIRVSENTLYLTPSGEQIPIREIVRLYEEEQQKTTIRTLSKTEELKEIVDTLVFYEKKYGGEYADTLGSKAELTSAEKRDAHEWKYLIKLLEESV